MKTNSINKLLRTEILKVCNLPHRMEKLFSKTLILLFAFMVYGSSELQAQTYPKLHQPYRMIEENHTDMVEVSVMVAQGSSSSADSVYVMVFNEKPVKDTISFDLTIYNQTKSDSTQTSFYYESAIGEMAIPECGKGNLRSLVVPLPSGYDPEKSTFAVKFK